MKKVLLGAAICGLAGGVVFCAELATGARWFEDVTVSAGVNKPHTNRSFDNQYANIMEGYTALGASATVADYDGDGYDDVFVTDSKLGGKNHLYHNNHNFTFTDVGDEAGVSGGNDENNATSASLWFDYNNDGKPDLYVVRFGHNTLYENLGNGKFKDVTKQAGLYRYSNAIKAIAFDYDRDGQLDLFVGSYFQPINIFNPSSPRFFPESFETANNGGGVTVFHNKGDGTFEDVTEKVGLKLSGWTLDMGNGDADNDGFDDLYIACDFGTDRFFHNNGNGTFTDITEKAIGFDTKKGMNVDWGDYDNDGLLDIYVTNITDDYMREGNFLWHNNGDLTFTDVSRDTGTAETGWGWGAKFFDYDNDGWLDLYVMNGWVSAGKDSYVPDVFKMITKPGIDFADARNWPPMGNKSLSGYEKKKLFHNEHGQSFRNDAARHGLDSTRDGRGIAIADFDNDGRLDIFAANANSEPYLYRNVMPAGPHWVQFALVGTKSNKAAVGAQVRLTAGGSTRLAFISGGNSFAGQSTNRVHFGLGSVAKIDKIDVRWPTGVHEEFDNITADKLNRIVEGTGKKTK
ncbi:MAG TPA: CRTAC1 family protein [Bryobacteraceae bacterium]|nr:CRTAC1 family protein [Bryobacteraceae bacterium]